MKKYNFKKMSIPQIEKAIVEMRAETEAIKKEAVAMKKETVAMKKETEANDKKLSDKLDKLLESTGATNSKIKGLDDNIGIGIEEIFFESINKTKKIGKTCYDTCKPNYQICNEQGTTLGEIDLLLLNGKEAAIIEVKHRITLIYFLGKAKTGNGSIRLNLDIIIKSLKLQKSNACSALSGLVKRNIVLKECIREGDRKNKKPTLYELSLQVDRINYNLAGRGKVKDYKYMQGKDPKIQMKLLDAPKEDKTLFDVD